MNRRTLTTLIVGATFVLSAVLAHAGPCSADIARFEKTVRHSTKNPEAGPTAPQSIDAQLGYQPTPSSVKRAKEGAQARFEAALTRAKTLDAEGKRAECMISPFTQLL